MYEFIKTETGWLLFWGPPPVVAVETAAHVPEAEAGLATAIRHRLSQPTRPLQRLLRTMMHDPRR